MPPEYDVVIVGAGLAGLSAALHATEQQRGKRIALVSASAPQAGGCSRYVQGINAAMGSGDSADQHATDTLEGGAFLGNPSLVRIMCNEAPALIRSLQEWGVPFQTSNDGALETGYFGGSRNGRSLYWKDRVGEKILEVLHRRLQSLGCEILSERHALDVVIGPDALCKGVVCVNKADCSIEIFRSGAVVLATGGGACVYPFRSTSPDKVASGLLMAHRAGCPLVDMEMVQFHPTGLYTEQPEGRGLALEEELRTFGGRLLDARRQPFMHRHDPRGDLATRDVVSRGIATEILQGHGTTHGTVYFDLSAIASDRIVERFPNMYRRIREVGIDLRIDRVVEVAPTAHYLMGGVVIGEQAQTSVPGLFVCGEDAGGVHGGNRLGGNGAIDALVFGRRAGCAAAQWSQGAQRGGNIEPPPLRLCDVTGDADQFVRRIERIMREHVSVIRTQAGLIRATGELADIHDKLRKQSREETIEHGAKVGTTFLPVAQLLDKAALAQLITDAALRRRHTAGAHFLADQPTALA